MQLLSRPPWRALRCTLPLGGVQAVVAPKGKGKGKAKGKAKG